MATPTDGWDDGEPVRSDGVVVGNTAPTLGAAELSPTTATEGTTITCTPSGEADVDGDDVAFTYAWTADGSSTGTTESTLTATTSTKATAWCASSRPQTARTTEPRWPRTR